VQQQARTSGFKGLFGSLFASAAVFGEPLESSSVELSSLAAFSSVAPLAVVPESSLVELAAAVATGMPVLLPLHQVTARTIIRAVLRQGAASIAAGSTASLGGDDSKLLQTFSSLPASATARDVLQKFVSEDVLHVHLQSVGDAMCVARSISRPEALRFVQSVLGPSFMSMVVEARNTLPLPRIHVLPEELLISVLRVLELSPEQSVACGDRILSWEMLESAGLRLVLQCLTDPLHLFLSKTRPSVLTDIPIRILLHKLIL